MHHHKARDGVGCLVAVVFVAVTLRCAVGGLIKVGSKDGWRENVNYTEWASHRHFYVGDWLYFVFDKRYFNVLEVNKSNYVECRDAEFVHNITRGGRDVFNLTEARTYYFLSGGGYCFHGMKLSIHVGGFPPPPPPPPPGPYISSSVGGGIETNQMMITIFSIVTSFIIFLFKIIS